MDRMEKRAMKMVDNLVSETPKEAWPIVAGTVSFGVTLATSTFTQLNLLGVSTGSRPPIPSVLGMASVCVASLVSHHAAITSHTVMEDFRTRRRISSNKSILNYVPDNLRSEIRSSESSFPYTRRRETLDIGGLFQVPIQTVRICVVGMLAFKLLGGRFWAISPSSYTHLGSFARRSIPATERYANPAQKMTLDRIGRWQGCHTCGSTEWFTRASGSSKFVGDHMPPKAVAQQRNARWYNRLLNRQVRYRFYPQCAPCSNRQGGLVSKALQLPFKTNLAGAGGGRLSHFHGGRFRWNHWAGGIVAGTTVVGATNDQIRKGNSGRYRALQTCGEKLVGQLKLNGLLSCAPRKW